MSDGFTGLFQLLVKTNKMHNYVLLKYIYDFRNFDEFFHAIARECFEVFFNSPTFNVFPSSIQREAANEDCLFSTCTYRTTVQ